MLWQITGIKKTVGDKGKGEPGVLEVGGTTVMYVDKKHWSEPVTNLRRDVTPQSSENSCDYNKHSEKAFLRITDSQPHKITESSVRGWISACILCPSPSL